MFDWTDAIYDMTNLQVQFMTKPKVNCQDLSDWVWSMMKTKQDNYMIDGTSVVYAESDNELS